MPLQEFVSRVQIVDVVDAITDASFVGYAVIDGVGYQHFSYRTVSTDFQAWIATEAPHLLKRVVIDYRDEPGQPQFRGQFVSFDLDPELPDDLFEFSKPDDAELIPTESKLEE